MINFNNRSQAQKIALHYAKNLNDDFAYRIILGQQDIVTTQDAIRLIKYFWNMVDLAVEDQEQGKNIEGVVNLEFYAGQVMNIILEYITAKGYADLWLK